MKRRPSPERREQEELALLREIQEECSPPYGCIKPQTPARNRLQKRGDIEHFMAGERAGGNRHRWRITKQGEERLR